MYSMQRLNGLVSMHSPIVATMFLCLNRLARIASSRNWCLDSELLSDGFRRLTAIVVSVDASGGWRRTGDYDGDSFSF